MSILSQQHRLRLIGANKRGSSPERRNTMSATATTILQPIPYLAFNGNCEEAMRFYESALGGEITLLMRGKDCPPSFEVPAEAREGVMNAQLRLPGGGWLFAGDTPFPASYEGIKGVSITLNYATAEEAEKAFTTLSEGGSTFMPFGPTFWAKGFGMCTDKFGTPWMVNGELAVF